MNRNYLSKISEIVIDNCIFVNNHADFIHEHVDDEGGGAISARIAYIRLNIKNSKFARADTKTSGGAINCHTNQDILIENCIFESNEAGFDGGALFFKISSECKVYSNGNRSIFKNNRANQYGGAIFVKTDKTFEISNVSFNGNSSGVSGGAVYMEGNHLKITNSEFNKQSSLMGGACFFYGLKLDVDASTFENNAAQNDGGAILYGGRCQKNTISNSKFLNNRSENGNGGAFFGGAFEIAFINSHFEKNRAPNGMGGGVFYDKGLLHIIENTTFKENSASSGGAICNSSHIILEGCDIPFINSIKIENAEFADNHAEHNGGAIFIDPTTSLDGCYAKNTIFNNNKAEYGAVSFNDHINYYNCLFVQNEATSNYIVNGRSLSGYNSSAYNFCTIADNILPSARAVIFKADSIKNTVIWGGTGHILLESCSAPNYCLLNSDTYGGSNNQTGNPEFSGIGDKPYKPTVSSPAIGNARASDLPSGTDGKFDLAGDIRLYPVDGSPDIGAYELKDKNIWYVDAERGSGGDGRSWSTAYNNLQSALALASWGDSVWIANGTYYPSENDRAATFVIPAGVVVLGGFAGVETDAKKRDWVLNPVVLSGEIGNTADITDNIITIVSMNEFSILEGFTISGGVSFYGWAGNAIDISNADNCVVKKCKITENTDG